MSNVVIEKAVRGILFSWRSFFSGIFMALDSYSPMPIDLAGWADPERENSPEEEEMIDKFERELLDSL